MSIESDLQDFLTREILVDSGSDPVGLDDSLMSSGRVDSMGLLKIVSRINEQYGVDVLESGEPEDFETISGLAAAIRRSQDYKGT